VLALQPLKRDPARELAAIWHAAVDVTIPSYSKTKQRQRLVIGKMSCLGNIGFIAPYVGRSVRVQPEAAAPPFQGLKGDAAPSGHHSA